MSQAAPAESAAAGARGARGRWLSWLARLGLAGIWLWAAWPKILAPDALLASVETYRLLPRAAAVAVALWLPWLEVATALGLLARPLRRAAALLSAGLMAMFTLGVVQAWARGLELDCGCFGAGSIAKSAGDYAWLVGRDLALLAASWALYRRESRVEA